MKIGDDEKIKYFNLKKNNKTYLKVNKLRFGNYEQN